MFSEETLSQHIANSIAKKIIKGELLDGERIQEVRICNEFNVSRGSVREALLILERSFLIEILPRRGAVVTELNVQQVKQLFDVLTVLCTHLVQKVCVLYRDSEWQQVQHATQQALHESAEHQLSEFYRAAFHVFKLMLPIVNNPFLSRELLQFFPATERCYALLVNIPLLDQRTMMVFFKETILAVQLRDADAAAKGMQRFLMALCQAVVQALMRMKQIELALAKRRGRPV